MYILFYSSKCKYSLQFNSTLQKTEEDRFFKKISVDTREGRSQAINQRITKVPTIIINDVSISGVEALRWLQEKIKSKSLSVGSISTRHNKLHATKTTEKQPVNIVTGYSSDNVFGTGSYSSSYADVEDHPKIITPPQDSEVVRPVFTLSPDNITSGMEQIQGKDKYKLSNFDNDLERMKNLR